MKDSITRVVASSDTIGLRIPILASRRSEGIVEEAHFAVKEERHKGQYNLAGNNCQHFCAEILGVQPYSSSVEKVKDGVKTIGVAASIMAGVTWLLNAFSKQEEKSRKKEKKETIYYPASDNYIPPSHPNRDYLN